MVVLLLWAVVAVPAWAQRLQLRHGQRVERISLREVEGRLRLPLLPLVQVLGLECRWREGRGLVEITGKAGRAVAASGSALALVGGLVIPLAAPPLFVDGKLYVTPDFLSNVVSRVLGRRISLSGLDARVTDVPALGEAALEPLFPPRIHTVLIDPGHGGKDNGATGLSGLREKDLTLALSLQLKERLEQESDIRVVLTRDADLFLGLRQRTAKANAVGGLLISVHANSGRRERARGFEVYSMAPRASDKAALEASRFENQVTALEGPSGDVEPMLWALAQNDYLNESMRFADNMVSTLSEKLESENRGAKQAPFIVLAGATVPAILIEVGFITNPEEEAALRTTAYQKRLVEAISFGIVRYLRHYETKYGHSLARP